jgi:glycosyltransferase involved in cell wall biosynthesis
VKVLAFNWRDPKHPEAGGAELHLFEILRRCVRDGDAAVWLAERFPGAPEEETVGGIRVVRAGSWYNAPLALAALYRRRFRGERFDLILEDINKTPFFAPLYARAPVLAVVPHLFGSAVFQETSLPIGIVVRIQESAVPFVYRHTPFLAISESTRDDLAARGIDPSRIHVVRCGLTQEDYEVITPPERRVDPVVVFLGRLRKYKGAQHAIRAMALVLRDVPGARLDVVGDGPYRPALERLTASLGLEEHVRFLGALPHRRKVEALNAAQVGVMPSPKEGWGLTVIEGNACGVPVVASRSPGLVESVRDGETGILVPHGDAAAIAVAVVRLLSDRALRLRMADAAIAWAHTFDWETCYRDSRAVMAEAASAGAAAG